MTDLLHITTRSSWLAAKKSSLYRTESLDTEGFIHCSTLDQVTAVADSFYRGQQGLVVLVIAPDRVQAEIRFEDCYETGQAFPHIYGPLPLRAVINVIPFDPKEDGSFDPPQI